MKDLTNEEYAKLSEKWTKTTPKIDPMVLVTFRSVKPPLAR